MVLSARSDCFHEHKSACYWLDRWQGWREVCSVGLSQLLAWCFGTNLFNRCAGPRIGVCVCFTRNCMERRAQLARV